MTKCQGVERKSSVGNLFIEFPTLDWRHQQATFWQNQLESFHWIAPCFTDFSFFGELPGIVPPQGDDFVPEETLPST